MNPVHAHVTTSLLMLLAEQPVLVLDLLENFVLLHGYWLAAHNT
jgi:hypothetical protein